MPGLGIDDPLAPISAIISLVTLSATPAQMSTILL